MRKIEKAWNGRRQGNWDTWDTLSPSGCESTNIIRRTRRKRQPWERDVIAGWKNEISVAQSTSVKHDHRMAMSTYPHVLSLRSSMASVTKNYCFLPRFHSACSCVESRLERRSRSRTCCCRREILRKPQTVRTTIGSICHHRQGRKSFQETKSLECRKRLQED